MGPAAIAQPPIAAIHSPAVIERGDWLAACDNVQSCVATALPADGAGRVWLSVSRSGDPSAPAVVKVALAVGGEAGAGVLKLRARGFEANLSARLSDDQLTAETRDAALTASLARLLSSDARALVVAAGGVEATLRLAGGEEALAFIDDRQGRSGSQTALVRRGAKPAALLAPAEAPPEAAAGGGPMAEVRPLTPPRSVLARPELAACDAATLSRTDAWGAWRLSPDLMLWSAPCASTPSNLTSLFFLTNERGADVRPAPVPPLGPLVGRAPEAAPPESLRNADFDPKTRILSVFEKARPQGDCGVLARLVWTGRAFEPVEVDYMPVCRGVTPEAWPQVYRARLRPPG